MAVAFVGYGSAGEKVVLRFSPGDTIGDVVFTRTARGKKPAAGALDTRAWLAMYRPSGVRSGLPNNWVGSVTKSKSGSASRVGVFVPSNVQRIGVSGLGHGDANGTAAHN